jgi:hypothetical protein
MGGHYFEQLGREILQMKRLMDKLQEENRELRQQITELREGRGIFIQIEDQRFALLANHEETMPTIPSAQPGNAITPVKAIDNGTSPLEKSPLEKTPAQTGLEKDPVPAEAAQVKEVTFLEEVMLDEFASALTTPAPATPDTQPTQKNTGQDYNQRLRHELQGSYLLE